MEWALPYAVQRAPPASQARVSTQGPSEGEKLRCRDTSVVSTRAIVVLYHMIPDCFIFVAIRQFLKQLSSEAEVQV